MNSELKSLIGRNQALTAEIERKKRNVLEMETRMITLKEDFSRSERLITAMKEAQGES